MPRKGFKSITVPSDLYQQLLERAGSLNLTLPDFIAKLFGEAFSEEKGSSGVQIPPSAPPKLLGKVSSKDHHDGLERINFRFKYRNMTVQDYGTIKAFERFVLIDRRLSMDSAFHYTNTVFRLLTFTGKPVKAIDKDDLREFLSLFSNNHTYRNNLKGLKVFFRDFMGRPELVGSFKFPRAELQPRFLPTKKQLSEFFGELSGHERPLFLLYASSGLRRSEVLDLRADQLDLENRAIIPCHATTQKKSWISFYNEEAESELKPWLTSEGKIFRLSSERKYLLFRNARIRTGLCITPQSLRFWFANEMARLGVPDRFIDAFQGRIPRSVLARHYTDYSLENLKQIYDRAGLRVLS